METFLIVWILSGILLSIKIMYDEWYRGVDITLFILILHPIFFGTLGFIGWIIWLMLRLDEIDLPIIFKGKK